MNEQGQQLVASLPGGGTPLAALTLDRAAGELRGGGGVERIDPKVMQVFTALLDAGGEVVSRETLLETAWPGAAVSDEVVTRCIYALRGHLVRAGGTSDYRGLLETLPKRGYRLNLAAGAAAPAAGPRRKGSVAAMAAIAAALGVLAVLAWMALDTEDKAPDDGVATAPAPAASLAIAVLPFLNIGADPEEQYFADGLSEELINLLAQTLDIRVVARTSSFAFRERNEDIGTIASELGVSHILEGSVRRGGDRLRITAQLIDTRDSSHVWSETFDRDIDDPFEVQDDIAAAVAQALHLELASIPSPGALPAVDPRAYEAYLRGRFLHHRRAPGDVDKALAYFEEAVRIDPDYALAWANVAGAVAVLQGEVGLKDAAMMEKRRVAVERALALGPGLAEVIVRAAQYYWDTGQRELAEELLRKAVALDPDDPLVLGFLAGRAAWDGDFDRAVELQQHALVRDPLSTINAGNLVSMLLATGRAAEAEVELQKLSAQRDSLPIDFEHDLAKAMILQERFDDALALVESWPEGNEQMQQRVILLYALGRREAADEALARLVTIPGLEGAVRRAEVLAFRGDVDAAFDELDAVRDWQVTDEPAPQDSRRVSRARFSPYLNTFLNGDPRWAGLWEGGFDFR